MSDNDENAVVRSGNGMGMQVTPLSMGGLISAEQQRALGELQGQIMLAKLYPRNQLQVLQDLKARDCTRVGLAAKAEYSYPRGGENVQGPSIRIMEAIARRWGNLQSGIKEIARGEENGFGYSECIAYAWDLETGYRDEKQFRVRHVRETTERGKDGKSTGRKVMRALTDERDIYELMANYGARRKRACLEAVIPGDVVEEVVQACRETLLADADTSPTALKRMMAAFAEIGVTQAQIEQKIGRRLDAIRPAQVLQLSQIYAAIEDGITTPQQQFEPLDNVVAQTPARPARTQAPQQTETPRKQAAQRKQAAPQTTQASAGSTAAPKEEEASAPAKAAQQEPAETQQEAGETQHQEEEHEPRQFEATLLDRNGEPVDGEVFLDPMAFANAFLEYLAQAPENEAQTIILQNADCLQDACDADPQADALLDHINLDEGTIAGAEEEQAQGEEEAGNIDPEELVASAILKEIPAYTTAKALITYSKSTDVLPAIKRWEQQGRDVLVKSVKSAFTTRLEALRAASAEKKS